MTILAGIGIFLFGVAVGVLLISLSTVTRKYFDEKIIAVIQGGIREGAFLAL